MNGCCQSRGNPDDLDRQDVSIRYRYFPAIVPHIPPFGRVTEGVTEIALRRVSRRVRRRMDGNADMSHQ
jgi:hypothetical protein